VIELGDDSAWSKLNHAYGSASDIPELLRQLAEDPAPNPKPEGEPWFTLWSSLCHQGDVYQASYAAVPHIVAIARTSPGALDFSFFQLPAAIEIARNNGRGPEVSAELSAPYFESISQLGFEVVRRIGEPWDQPTLLSALSVLAITKCDYKVAEAIFNFDDDIIARVIELDF
jgi:hypothetical protein